MTEPADLSRRTLLKTLGAAAGLALTHTSTRAAPAAAAGPRPGRPLADPLHDSSATAIARAIRDGELSAVEVTGMYIDRIGQVNPKIHAVVQLQAEAALARARDLDALAARKAFAGPLHGVPVTIKDSLDTAGIVSTAGTEGRAAFVPPRDASVVRRLREAGAIVLGKTNTPELTLHGYTENLLYERTNNPYDPGRSPMGSSGGAAAIVAAGGSGFDIGSDTGGSIRIPAHVCGVCGLRPTSGRVARTGHILSWETYDESLTTLGPIARYVEDLATVLPLIAGSDGIDPFACDLPIGDPAETVVGALRVAFYTDNGIATPTANIREAVQGVAQRVAETGARVQEARPKETELALDLLWRILGADRGYGIHRILAESGTERVAPYMAWTQGDPARFDEPGIAPREVAETFMAWNECRSGMTRFFADYDVLLCPASAIPAPTHDVEMKYLEETMLSYTAIYNITGWPVAVVRVGTSEEGLPIGIQIVGKPWREDVVLAVARFVESEFGGFVPPSI